MHNPALFCLLSLSPALTAQDDPAINAWRLNLDGTTGQSSVSSIHNIVSQIEADVEETAYTNANAYVSSASIPSHTIGPWPGNPNMPNDRNYTFRIKRNPQPATGNHMATPLGAMAVAVNGVALFNALDGRSYRNRNVWHQSAVHWEGQSFDVGKGHPTGHGDYHYHATPTQLQMQVGDNGMDHSPILGFAFDGYPIYGPYAYSNSNGTGGIRRMESSYVHRNITKRHTLPDGTQLNQGDWGPDVSAQYPVGAYAEDFSFTTGAGDLDEHNGRDCITPEYPQGTYAYFMTLDASGEFAYPYIIGPTYYGVVDTGNTGPGGGHLNVPGNATDYLPFSVYANDVISGGTARIAIGNATPQAHVVMGYSMTGAGPTTSPIGDLALSAPIRRMGPYTADGQGLVEFTTPVPLSVQGMTLYYQAAELSLAGLYGISRPGRVVIQ
ncbi:MAG: YHYH protein [Planctomycetes bacterium]|nr:YHYH protein [Planctomycetota bacterium]